MQIYLTHVKLLINMKNILIITAHPSTFGYTHKIANTYKETQEKIGNHVDIINLYDKENQLPFVTFQNIREDWPKDEVKDKMKEKLKNANELVFVHPIWWGGVPAIMKNFIDHTFEPRLAYKYEESGLKKLFTGKTAKIFATSGTYSFLYTLPFSPFWFFWKFILLGFCGVKVKEIKVCGSLDSSHKDQREIIFEKFLNKVRNSK